MQKLIQCHLQVENIVCKDDDNQIDHKNKSDTTVKETTPALQLLSEEETADASKTLIKGEVHT